MKTYYILSLKWSPSEGQAVWWGPDNAGYKVILDQARVYTQEQIDSNPSYYNNGATTRAIPVEEVDQLAERLVYFDRVKRLITIKHNTQ